ncbi:MAG: thiol:disulfide interchange protein, partial [Rhodothermales bacterium]|nr:thiol:disulfide interchange protein [Rhodothermales bacterium]
MTRSFGFNLPRLLGLLFLAAVVVDGSAAQSLIPQLDPDDPNPHSDVWLVSEQSSIRPGETFTVALRMTMDEDWHSYWKNPGDSGRETFIEWDLPEGFEAGEIQWPYPERVDLGPLTSYGYSDEVFLLTNVTAPEGLEPGTDVNLAGVADWLICAEICLLAKGEVSLSLPVSGDAPDTSEWADEIEDARRKLPAVAADWTVRALRSSGTYALHITPPEGRRIDLEGASFYPEIKGAIDHAAVQPVTQDGRAYILALQQSEYAQEPVDRMIGVLVAPKGESFVRGERRRALLVDASVEESQTAGISPVEPVEEGLSLGWAVLFALMGGVLLNLMPCVFPILSIKILGFARQSEDSEADIRKHGFIFASGVIVSFWVLAGLVLGLRAGGSE